MSETKPLSMLDKISEQEKQLIKQEIESKGSALRELYTYYRCAMMEVETKFKVLNEQFSLQHDRNPIQSVKTRLKSIDSLAEKLMTHQLKPTIESVTNHIFDVAGVRVICSFADDVYDVAQSFLAQDDIDLLETKDYIKAPKKNGYRSLHLIVAVPIFLANEKKMMPVEIQLRTMAMDFWASLEHQLLYKKDVQTNDIVIQGLKNCADIMANLDLTMNQLMNSLNVQADEYTDNM